MARPARKFRIRVEGGDIKPYDRDGLSRELSILEGKDCSLVIKKWRTEKTVAQLGYFFGVVVREALKSEEFGGWTRDEFYGYIKDKFFKYRKETASGDIVSIISGFSEMSMSEASEKIDDIIRWLIAEHGCYIPSSGEVETPEWWDV